MAENGGIRKSKWPSILAVVFGALFLIGADQVTKWLVLDNLAGQPAVGVIPGLLEFCYVENYAAAMGLFDGMIWVVVVCTVVVSLGILLALVFYKGHTVFTYLTCMLLLAGGIGNLCDRFLHGFVVDFIHVLFFPYVFNVADCCVTLGVACFILYTILQARKEKAEKASEGA